MKTLLTRFWIQTSLALMVAGEAFAAEEVHHDAPAAVATDSHAVVAVDPHAAAEAAGHAAGAAEHASGGLPQLDPTWFASQLFWLSITFVAMYVIFSRNILPKLSGAIETRRDHVQRDLDTALRLKEEAEEVQKAYDEILGESRARATDLYSGSESEAKAAAAQQFDAFRERSLKQIQETEARIEKAKKGAMNDMTTIAAEIASKAAEKIVGISTDINQAKSVVQNLNKEAA